MSTAKKQKKPAAVGLDAAFGALSGMSSFLSTEPPPAPEVGGPLMLALDQLHPDPEQPRREFDEVALEELAQSIAAQGVIQPITVRRHPDIPDAWMIVTGERRWRASRLAGRSEIPTVLDEREPGDRLVSQIVENVQRNDLRAMEIVRGYGRLADEFGMTATQIAKQTGKSKQVVGEYLAVLDMPEDYRNALETGAVRDVTALVALWRLREKHPQAVADLLASGTSEKPVTRALVRAITEQGGGESTAAVPPRGAGAGAGSSTGSTKGQGGEAGDKPGRQDGAGEGRDDSSSTASTAPHGGNRSASLPVWILVRYQGESYWLRYDSQKDGTVLLENDAGLTIYAPLLDLTIVSIHPQPTAS